MNASLSRPSSSASLLLFWTQTCDVGGEFDSFNTEQLPWLWLSLLALILPITPADTGAIFTCQYTPLTGGQITFSLLCNSRRLKHVLLSLILVCSPELCPLFAFKVAVVAGNWKAKHENFCLSKLSFTNFWWGILGKRGAWEELWIITVWGCSPCVKICDRITPNREELEQGSSQIFNMEYVAAWNLSKVAQHDECLILFWTPGLFSNHAVVLQ